MNDINLQANLLYLQADNLLYRFSKLKKQCDNDYDDINLSHSTENIEDSIKDIVSQLEALKCDLSYL